jgi:hypothetical protein
MKKKFSQGYIEFIQPDILKVVYDTDAPINFECIMEISAIRQELNVPLPYRALGIYNQSLTNINESFKLFVAQNEDAAAVRIADANVVKSGLKLEASHYQNFYNPVVPTKFFSDEEEAIQWLKQQ